MQRHLDEQHRETEQHLNEYINYLMAHSDSERPAWNLELLRGSGSNRWNYVDGCMITGILQLYELSGEQRYLDFADRFVSGFVCEDGSIRNYDAEENSLDNVNPARNLFALYDFTGKEKYRKALDAVRAQLETHPRTEADSFWHKAIYPWQVWLDGIYMAQPFYLEYERRYRGGAGAQDACEQIERVRACMRDAQSGLYYHGYDESRSMYWADPKTGCSPNFWLRALGWFILGLVDSLEILEKMPRLRGHFEQISAMLCELSEALSHYQDRKSGLYYQLIDLPELAGNYLETSGTALISAAVLKAVRLGYLPGRFRTMGERGFYGICDHRLSYGADGAPCLKGICLVAGLGGKSRRDGSASYYLSEPVVENDAKGVGPFLLAYAEMLRSDSPK